MLTIENNEIFFTIDNKVLIKTSFAFDQPDACVILNNINFDPSLSRTERERFGIIFYEELYRYISARIPENRNADLFIYAPTEIIKILHGTLTKPIAGHYSRLMIRPANSPIAEVKSIIELSKELGAKKVDVIFDKQILIENAEALCQLMLQGAYWAQFRNYTPDFVKKLIYASTLSTALRVEYDNGQIEWPCFVRNISSTANGLFYIADMCTHPHFQNKGIGTVILQANLKNTPSGAVGLLTLGSEEPGLTAGEKLYRKFGFKFYHEYEETLANNKMQLHFELIPAIELNISAQLDKNSVVSSSLQQFMLAPPNLKPHDGSKKEIDSNTTTAKPSFP